jgi:hypothetical protein
MNNINSVRSVHTLTSIMEKHVKLSLNELAASLSIDLSNYNISNELRRLFLNALRYSREKLIIE